MMVQPETTLLMLQQGGISASFLDEGDPYRGAKHALRVCAECIGADSWSLWEVLARETPGDARPQQRGIVNVYRDEGTPDTHREVAAKFLDDHARRGIGAEVYEEGRFTVLALPRPARCGHVVVFGFDSGPAREMTEELKRELRATGDVLWDALVKSMRAYVGDTAEQGGFSLAYLFYEGVKEAAFLFADLRGFTTICEALTLTRAERTLYSHGPKPVDLPSVREVIQDFSEKMADAVFRHGRLERIMGDGILAIYGDMDPLSPVSGPRLTSRPGERRKHRLRSCASALASALAMHDGFRELKEAQWDRWLEVLRTRRGEALEPRLGIGIGFGQAEFGFFGGQNRREYSVDGPHVNLAKRIENLAARRAGPPEDWYEDILVSQTVVSSLGRDTFGKMTDVRNVPVQGISIPIAVHEIHKDGQGGYSTVRGFLEKLPKDVSPLPQQA